MSRADSYFVNALRDCDQAVEQYEQRASELCPVALVPLMATILRNRS